jgi:S-(hydroxymethyl)glutathione dehydrogenase / alcohol dehydrogenase
VSRMRAAVCYEFGKPLAIEEIELEPPQAGEIRVHVAACAICHSDISWWDGSWGGVLPAVFGHEAAGVVAEVGPGVAVIVPGDHVIVSLIRYCGRCYYCAQGEPALCETRFRLDETGPLLRQDGGVITQGLRTAAFAEEVVVHASQVVAIPKDVPLDAASLLACGVITGVGAVVNTARVPVGSSVVVIGTGGVGLNSVQGAALSGATPIVAIDVAAEKLKAARAFGASHAVDATRENVREVVLGLTGGRGADYVFATVGAKGPIEQGLSLLRRAGTLVIVGMPPSGVMTEFEPGELANDSQRILGSKVGSARPDIDLPKLLELYRQGRLKLDELISGRYPLEAINDAIASVNRGAALRNVIVF